MIASQTPNRMSRRLRVLVLVSAVVVLPFGVASAQDYDALRGRLDEAVKKGEITRAQEGVMLEALKKVETRQAQEDARPEAVRREMLKDADHFHHVIEQYLRRVVEEGKAPKKPEAVRGGAFEDGLDLDPREIEQRLRRAVEKGNAQEEARKMQEALKKRQTLKKVETRRAQEDARPEAVRSTGSASASAVAPWVDSRLFRPLVLSMTAAVSSLAGGRAAPPHPVLREGRVACMPRWGTTSSKSARRAEDSPAGGGGKSGVISGVRKDFQ